MQVQQRRPLPDQRAPREGGAGAERGAAHHMEVPSHRGRQRVCGRLPRPGQHGDAPRGRRGAGVARLEAPGARDAGPPRARHVHARRDVGHQDDGEDQGVGAREQAVQRQLGQHEVHRRQDGKLRPGNIPAFEDSAFQGSRSCLLSSCSASTSTIRYTMASSSTTATRARASSAASGRGPRGGRRGRTTTWAPPSP